MIRAECPHCDETFRTAYARNLHETVGCDGQETEGSARRARRQSTTAGSLTPTSTRRDGQRSSRTKGTP